MLDSIYIGMSGLEAHSRNLRTIAGNTAHLDTPGFKASSTEFASLVDAGPGGAGLPGGPTVTGQRLDLSAGTLRPSSSALDSAIDGAGFFVLQHPGATSLLFTRDGRFEFDGEGWLVHAASGARVMARSEGGGLEAIRLEDIRQSAAVPTAVVNFSGVGYLDNEVDPATGQRPVITLNEEYVDVAGIRRSLRLEISVLDSLDGGVEKLQVKAFEGDTERAAMTLEVGADGQPVPGQEALEFKVSRPGLADQTIRLDLGGGDVRLYTGTTGQPTLDATPDGYVAGALVMESLRFDTEGRLSASYTNGRSETAGRLALADVLAPDALRLGQGGAFEAVDPDALRWGVAGHDGFGSVASSNLESSNVDLSAQFSDLVIAQRGYQASSQILATANEMLQQLFTARGR